MRVIEWDLIRGGHYGQRPCEPRLKAEHMAAPTNAANLKKALANSEPSTHGPKQTFHFAPRMSAFGGKADRWRHAACDPEGVRPSNSFLPPRLLGFILNSASSESLGAT
jgi:hypothetical protein